MIASSGQHLPEPLTLAKDLFVQGTSLVKGGRSGKSISKFTESETILRELVGNGEHGALPILAEVLNALGRVLSDHGKLDEGMVKYEESERICRSLVDRGEGRVLRDLASVLNNIGQSLSEQRKEEQALIKGFESECVYRQLLHQGEQRILPEFARVLHRCGYYLLRQGKPTEAIPQLEEAEGILRKLSDGTQDCFDPHLARVVRLLGDALRDTGKPNDAVAKYREAERIFQELVVRDKERYSHELAELIRALDVLSTSSASEVSRPSKPRDAGGDELIRYITPKLVHARRSIEEALREEDRQLRRTVEWLDRWEGWVRAAALATDGTVSFNEWWDSSPYSVRLDSAQAAIVGFLEPLSDEEFGSMAVKRGWGDHDWGSIDVPMGLAAILWFTLGLVPLAVLVLSDYGGGKGATAILTLWVYALIGSVLAGIAIGTYLAESLSDDRNRVGILQGNAWKQIRLAPEEVPRLSTSPWPRLPELRFLGRNGEGNLCEACGGRGGKRVDRAYKTEEKGQTWWETAKVWEPCIHCSGTGKLSAEVTVRPFTKLVRAHNDEVTIINRRIVSLPKPIGPQFSPLARGIERLNERIDRWNALRIRKSYGV